MLSILKLNNQTNQMQPRIKKLLFLALLALFFFFGVHFYGRISLWLLLIDVLALMVCLIVNKFKPSIALLVLIAFSFFYFIFLENKDFSAFIRYCISIPTLFVFGSFLSKNASWHQNKMLFYTLFLGFCLYQALTLIKNYNTIDETRFTFEFWQNESTQPTNFNSLGVFIIACFPAVFLSREKLITKLVFSISLLLVILAALKTATRTNIYLLIVVLVLDLIFYFIQRIRHNITNKEFKQTNWMIFISLLITGALAIAFRSQILSTFENSLMASRIQNQGSYLILSNDGRWESWSRVFYELFEFPFGNPSSYPAHNFFLDVGRVSGLIPFFLSILFFAYMTYVFLRIVFSKKILYQKKLFYFSTYIGVFLSFMIEPVLEGRPYNFLVFILLCGSMYGEFRKNKQYSINIYGRND